LPMISLGAKGVISVVSNAFPKEFSEMVRFALQNKFEEAKAIHYKLIDFIGLLFQENNPGGIKAALEIKELVSNNLRLPLTRISEELYTKISNFIKH
jgi:4-hydroxy-tetrahydrodipicolinate synthase